MDWYSANDVVSQQQIKSQYGVLYFDIPSNMASSVYELKYTESDTTVQRLGVFFTTDYLTLSANIIKFRPIKTQLSCKDLTYINAANYSIGDIYASSNVVFSANTNEMDTYNKHINDDGFDNTVVANQHYIDYGIYQHLQNEVTNTISSNRNNIGNVFAGNFTSGNNTRCVSFVRIQNKEAGDGHSSYSSTCGGIHKPYTLGSYCIRHGHGSSKGATIAIFHHSTNANNEDTTCTFRGNYITPIAIS